MRIFRAFFSYCLWLFAWLCSRCSHLYIMAGNSVLSLWPWKGPLSPLLLLNQCLSCFLATLIDCYQWFLLEFVHLRFPVTSHCITQTILLKICHKTFRTIICTNTIPICFFNLFLCIPYSCINVF